MPNPYFKFKKFTVYHNLCAMKVGTDGVLLGAWADYKNPKSIIDIGSGSGLISLMMAQRFDNAKITSVEIDAGGFKQSCLNANNSIYKNQIQNVHSSIQAFANNKPQTFDLLVSNPPFFEGAHTSGHEQRDLARHNAGLMPQDFWQAVQSLSHKNSQLAVILPVKEGETFIALGREEGWHLHEKCAVKGSPNAKVKRLLLNFGQAEVETKPTEIVLESTRGNYTPEFANWVKDFYLKLK